MMRKRTPPTSHTETQNIDTLIGAHSVITGELSFEGAVRIDGKFEGNIHSSQGGTLIVSEGAKIIGNVDVPSLILHGNIEGDVRATESLKLGATGCLNGDVDYKMMSLAEGSAINGRCNRISDNIATLDTAKANKPSDMQQEKLQEV